MQRIQMNCFDVLSYDLKSSLNSILNIKSLSNGDGDLSKGNARATQQS